MDSRSLAEQEKDIREQLRRAERTPVKTSASRKDTLKRLIDLAHSEHASLKIIAATNLKLFIKDFPELEDEAINAVYDLCEDPVSSVRIKGYAAIVDVSREQQKWVKRNADVLVQLLQSDEPEEVTFVKRALTQHLDMDPVVTLGVICDQVVPPDEPFDEEEQSIRDRLRSLVLAFLAGEAKRSLVERHTSSPGSPAEQILVTGLLKAIPKLSPGDVDVIVKDVLASLPSFKLPSTRGKELLDILLAHARAALKHDLPSGNETGALQNTRYYLELASFISVDHRLVNPSHLLRFYYTTLTPKLVLGRLHEEDQAYIIRSVAKLLAASDEGAFRAPPTAPAADLAKTLGSNTTAADEAALRKQFPDVCTVLLQVFAGIESDELRPWTACLALLQGIVRRTKDGRWRIPQNLISSLQQIEFLSAVQDGRPTEKNAAQQQAHSVIRSLLEPINLSASSIGQADASAAVGSVDGQKGSDSSRGDQRRIMNVNKRKLDATNGPPSSNPPSPSSSRAAGVLPSARGPRNGLPVPPTSLPARPTESSAFPSIGGSSNGPHADRQRQAPPHLKGRPASSARAESTTDGLPANAPGEQNQQADEGAPRSAKRARTEGRRGGRGDGNFANPNSTPHRGGGGSTQSTSNEAKEAAKGSQAEGSTSVPSLLSRLFTGSSNGKPAVTTPEREQTPRDRGHGRRGRADSERGGQDVVVPTKRRAELSATSTPPSAPVSIGRPRPRSSPELDKDPVGGLRIRGAAKAASRSSPTGGDGPGAKGPTSLLQRMQPLGEGNGGFDESGGRRRKKGRHM